MSIATFLFYFFELLAAVSAISLLFIRNVFYGALLLIVCLLAIAGIYILAFAEFLAVAQILIYAGGILVVIIFGIMLTSKISGKPLQVSHTNRLAGVLVGVFFFSLLVKNFATLIHPSSKGITPSVENTYQSIGILLMSDYVLPFEIAGIVLLVTLVGSAVTASYIKPKE
jgi:NADH:ubiquinone oxidoreductase subunit 6 (subunit J)